MSRVYGTTLFSSPDFQNGFKQLSINRTNLSTRLKLSFTVPDSFDGSELWKEYFIPIDSQMDCMSCWAFASTFVLSSRLAIYTLGKYKYNFSKGKMIFSENWTTDKIKNHLTKGLAFDYTNHIVEMTKCREESLLYGHQYLYRYGVPENSCVDDRTKLDNIYNSNQLFGATYDICPANNKEMVSYRADGYYYVPGAFSKDNKLPQGSEYNIRKDIYHWGPVSTVMKVFDDFLSWDGQGIYEWDGISNLKKPFVGHAVVIVGWGTSAENVPYWIIRNSWGTSWGDNGYFKMKRGTNNCEIEENCFVCYPSLPGIRLYLEHPILYIMDDFVIRGLWGIYDNGIKLTTKEKLILRKIDENVNDAFLYDPSSWVDFSKMLSGDKSTYSFLVTQEGFCINNENNDEITKVDNSLSLILNILVVIIAFKLISRLS